MSLFNRLYEFAVPLQELIEIYILIIRKVKKLIQCKIFHIKFNYLSGSFQICKEAMHIDSLRVNGMSVKLFISVRSYFHHRVIYRPRITIPILYSFDMKVFSDSLNIYIFFHVLVDNPDSPTKTVLS